jgi:hypothetical protein
MTIWHVGLLIVLFLIGLFIVGFVLSELTQKRMARRRALFIRQQLKPLSSSELTDITNQLERGERNG